MISKLKQEIFIRAFRVNWGDCTGLTDRCLVVSRQVSFSKKKIHSHIWWLPFHLKWGPRVLSFSRPAHFHSRFMPTVRKDFWQQEGHSWILGAWATSACVAVDNVPLGKPNRISSPYLRRRKWVLFLGLGATGPKYCGCRARTICKLLPSKHIKSKLNSG